MKCCLVIGHTPEAPGAVNVRAQLTEFEFNDRIAKIIEQKVRGVDVELVYRGRPNQYNQLPAKINSHSPEFIISLHANAFNGSASGTEVLYWHTSAGGKRLARVLQNHLLVALGLPDRGIKPRQAGDRGGHLLRFTAAPCVIAEPFFIDNDHDLGRAQGRLDELARAYATTIEEYGEQPA